MCLDSQADATFSLEEPRHDPYNCILGRESRCFVLCKSSTVKALRGNKVPDSANLAQRKR